jgi:L-fucose dehydrogenase
MDLQLRDKVCLVTGGASGIGLAIVRRLAAEGSIPVILDLMPAFKAESLLAEFRELGQSVDYHQVDLTDDGGTAAVIENILTERQRIDALINNAGVNDSAGLDATPDEFRSSLEKNLVQCFTIVHHSRKALMASAGSIVNIASKVALTGQGGTSGYAAAKGGLLALTREWALDLSPHNIRVNAIVPAEVWTPMYKSWLSKQAQPEVRKTEIESRIPLGQRMTTAEEIADTTAFLLSPRSSHTTAQILHIDGGYVHLDRAFRG